MKWIIISWFCVLALASITTHCPAYHKKAEVAKNCLFYFAKSIFYLSMCVWWCPLQVIIGQKMNSFNEKESTLNNLCLLIPKKKRTALRNYTTIKTLPILYFHFSGLFLFSSYLHFHLNIFFNMTRLSI